MSTKTRSLAMMILSAAATAAVASPTPVRLIDITRGQQDVVSKRPQPAPVLAARNATELRRALTTGNSRKVVAVTDRVAQTPVRAHPLGRPVRGSSCLADTDGNLMLNELDMYAFLDRYFASDALADINDSGSVSVQDVFDYVTAYIRGCDAVTAEDRVAPPVARQTKRPRLSDSGGR